MQQQTTSTLDVYQIVTDRIIELLGAGTVPWKKPWVEAGLHESLITRNQYKCIDLGISLPYGKNKKPRSIAWQNT